VVTQVVTSNGRERAVPEIGVKDLKANASKVIDEVQAGASYVVTKRGRPAAVIVPVEEAEDLVLANAEEFIRMRRTAREDLAKGRTVKLKGRD
jgi:prevent-host-death family protein